MTIACDNCGKAIPKDKAVAFLDAELWTRYCCSEECKLKSLIKHFSKPSKDSKSMELHIMYA